MFLKVTLLTIIASFTSYNFEIVLIYILETIINSLNLYLCCIKSVSAADSKFVNFGGWY